MVGAAKKIPTTIFQCESEKLLLWFKRRGGNKTMSSEGEKEKNQMEGDINEAD